MQKQILIVDDDLLCLQLLSMLVREIGFDVIEASSGEEAREKFNSSICCVVTDMHMETGKMNGNDIAAMVKAERRDMKTILLFSPYMIDPIKDRFDHILQKPVKFDEVINVLPSLH